jgi:hypothetical protein
MLNPVGRVRLLRFKAAVPRFLTLKVLLRVPPIVALPKSRSLRVPSTISVVPSNTWISGAGALYVTLLSVLVLTKFGLPAVSVTPLALMLAMTFPLPVIPLTATV